MARKLPQLPQSLNQVVRDGEGRGKPPVLRIRKKPKGDPEPTGRRLTQYGQSEEERLMAMAPTGTKPERLLYGWLARAGIDFTFQQPFMGGRTVAGGAVVDFVIYERNPAVAIRVMSYWHDPPDAKWRDDEQRASLEALGLQVEDVWDYELDSVDDVDRRMREILYGTRRMSTVAAMASSGKTGWVDTLPTEDSKGKCPHCGDPCCCRMDGR